MLTRPHPHQRQGDLLLFVYFLVEGSEAGAGVVELFGQTAQPQQEVVIEVEHSRDFGDVTLLLAVVLGDEIH